MTPDQASLLSDTISHFQEVARQNRFPENNRVEHDKDRCVICHPELLPLEPFAVYLDVVAQAVKVRRPRVDPDFVAEINKDLALSGRPATITRESLLNGEEASFLCWTDWIREALSTGLGLLSIHSPTSREFDLDEAQEEGFGQLIQSKIEEIIDYQKTHS